MIDAPTVVLDASATGALVLPDETSAAVDAFYERARRRSTRWMAPALWVSEVGSLLSMAQRRGRVTVEELDVAWGLLSRSNVEIEQAPDWLTAQSIFHLAHETGLTFYDATYLELARRTQALLISADRAMLRAAASRGIACHTLE